MKFLKWILGIIAGLGGLVALFAGGNKNSKVKKQIHDNEEQIKKVDKEISAIKQGNEALKRTLLSKKEALEEMKRNKERGPVKKKVAADEAADFLKKYANKKKKK